MKSEFIETIEDTSHEKFSTEEKNDNDNISKKEKFKER